MDGTNTKIKFNRSIKPNINNIIVSEFKNAYEMTINAASPSIVKIASPVLFHLRMDTEYLLAN